jgi:putative oxidoreductase
VDALSSGEGARQIQGAANLGFPAPELFAWAAALSEFAGGIAVALGLGTRVAASFAAFTMGVAAFGRHKAHLHFLNFIGTKEVPEETLKAWGNPEPALLFLLIMLAIVLAGPGGISIDRALSGSRRRG